MHCVHCALNAPHSTMIGVEVFNRTKKKGKGSAVAPWKKWDGNLAF